MPLIVIDKDAEVLAEAEERGLLCMLGDPTRDDDLLAAHVKEALGLVAATGNDSDNVYIADGPRPESRSPYRSTSFPPRCFGQAAEGRSGPGDLATCHRRETYGALGDGVGSRSRTGLRLDHQSS